MQYIVDGNREIMAIHDDGQQVLHLYGAGVKAFRHEGNILEVGSILPDDAVEIVIDPNAFNTACSAFRQVCAAIGALIGRIGFKGGFDEMTEFQASEQAMTMEGIALALQWGAADKLCTYEGAKLGLGQPEWWYKCWEDA